MKQQYLTRVLLASLLWTLVLSTVCSAQSIPLGSTNLSGTISATGAFQTVQDVTNNRNGCTIQNNGTHTMYVYFGSKSNASTGASAQLSPTQALNCSIASSFVVKDAVNITGTAGDSFFANFQ